MDETAGTGPWGCRGRRARWAHLVRKETSHQGGPSLHCQTGSKSPKRAPFLPPPPPLWSCLQDPVLRQESAAPHRWHCRISPVPIPPFLLPLREPKCGCLIRSLAPGGGSPTLSGGLFGSPFSPHPVSSRRALPTVRTHHPIPTRRRNPGGLGLGWGSCDGAPELTPSPSPVPGAPGPRGEAGSPGVDGVHGEKGAQGECAVAPRSAFSAKRSEARSPPLADQPIRFDVVLVNEQGHYDPATGKFTCEVPGLYYFAVHATVYRASLQFDLMKNGQSVASFFQYYGNWPKPTSLSGGALVRLEPEDEVWVQVGVGDYIGFYASVKTDSTFTGFLVYSYWHNSAVFA
uniref:C1q and TNF related 5 n=1 Tax=Anser brachyrhynchus TaxID=132585 RepID=A0A8B9BIF1_9AVES